MEEEDYVWPYAAYAQGANDPVEEEDYASAQEETAAGSCRESGTRISDGTITLSFDRDKINQMTCDATRFSLEELGDSAYDLLGGTVEAGFDLKIDLRTAFALLAYKRGTLSVENGDLIKITDNMEFYKGGLQDWVKNGFLSDPEANIRVDDFGSTPETRLSLYYDRKYPTMNPLYIDNWGTAAMRVGDVFMDVSFGGLFWVSK